MDIQERRPTDADGGADLAAETAPIRAQIQRCVAGDPEASQSFHQEYGQLIYSYPIRAYRMSPDRAGDFYVFAFERGRIYRRLRTYEGRAPFRAYLLGFVLDDLVLEWMRSDRRLETVAIDDVDALPDPNPSGARDGDDACAWLSRGLSELAPLRAAVLKLLYIEDWELTASEVRALAETSGRSMAEVVRRVEALRAAVRDREAALKGIEDHLGTVHVWVQLYERRLRALDAEVARHATPDRLAEREAMRHKLARRRQQRAKLLARTKRRKITAPYKDIAAVFNTTVGNIGSYISRARDELREKGFAAMADELGSGSSFDQGCEGTIR